jgi:primosomal protein N'
MAKYRARTCPHCHYYVAFSISKPIVKPHEATVTSFCLNCGYKIPVRGIVHGIRRAASPVRRGLLRLVNATTHSDFAAKKADQETEARSAPPCDYGCHLRAVGQDLENLRLSRFNLEYNGNSYLVWPRGDTVDSPALPAFRFR